MMERISLDAEDTFVTKLDPVPVLSDAFSIIDKDGDGLVDKQDLGNVRINRCSFPSVSASNFEGTPKLGQNRTAEKSSTEAVGLVQMCAYVYSAGTLP